MVVTQNKTNKTHVVLITWVEHHSHCRKHFIGQYLQDESLVISINFPRRLNFKMKSHKTPTLVSNIKICIFPLKGKSILCIVFSYELMTKKIFKDYHVIDQGVLLHLPSVMDSKYLSSKMIGREFTSPSRSAHSTGRGGKDRK